MPGLPDPDGRLADEVFRKTGSAPVRRRERSGERRKEARWGAGAFRVVPTPAPTETRVSVTASARERWVGPGAPTTLVARIEPREAVARMPGDAVDGPEAVQSVLGGDHRGDVLSRHGSWFRKKADEGSCTSARTLLPSGWLTTMAGRVTESPARCRTGDQAAAVRRTAIPTAATAVVPEPRDPSPNASPSST